MATVIQGLSYGLAVAVTVLLAYDAKLGRPLRMRGYIGAALSVIVPLFLVSLLVQILIGLGILALVVPGLWLIAVFSVVVPAVVIERAGSGALARSAELTRGYRWPILGLFLIMWLIALGLAAALGAIVLGARLPSSRGRAGPGRRIDPDRPRRGDFSDRLWLYQCHGLAALRAAARDQGWGRGRHARRCLPLARRGAAPAGYAHGTGTIRHE
ncbi:MAG: hypothetical protein JKP98_15080 [Rhodobacteraceae bacterium]|nr:hypothetical protein [Paracoccaceae bacterium]